MRLDAKSKRARAMLDRMPMGKSTLTRAAQKALEVLDDAAARVDLMSRAARPPSMSLAEYRDNPKQRRHQKYKNKVTETPDGRFDSEAEYRHWCHLKLRARLGEITDLQRQVVFELAPAVVIQGRKRPALRYISDMTYMEGGKLVVADVKGAITPEYRIKRHLMASVHGVEIQEIRA